MHDVLRLGPLEKMIPCQNSNQTAKGGNKTANGEEYHFQKDQLPETLRIARFLKPEKFRKDVFTQIDALIDNNSGQSDQSRLDVFPPACFPECRKEEQQADGSKYYQVQHTSPPY